MAETKDLFAFPSSRFNLLKPKTYFMYRQFNAQQFQVLPTQSIYVLYASEDKQRLFPYTALTDLFL